MRRIIATLLLALFSVQFQYSYVLAELSEHELEQIHQFFNLSGCLQQENLSFNDVIPFVSGNIQDAEGNSNVKCFVSCFFKFIGMMDDCSFDIDKNRLWPIDDQLYNEMQEKVQKCKDSVNGEDSCDCGYQLAVCLDALEEEN